jgi:hypothetical protein
MINKTPWIARNIAGAKLLKDFGTVYETEEQLTALLSLFPHMQTREKTAYEYVIKNHLIKNTVDDILALINTK